MNSLDEVVIKMAEELLQNGQGPLYDFFRGMCFIIGMVLMILGIMRMARAASAGPMGMHNPYAGPLATMIVGVLVLVIARTANELTYSIFEDGGGDVLAYSTQQITAVGVGDKVNAVLFAVLQFVAFIGWLGILRGLFIMKATAEGSGQAGIGTAVTHIVGGVLAINLGTFLQAMEASLGFGDWINIS